MPLNEKKFISSLIEKNNFENNPTVAVGVSGGPDSMALLMLVKDWIKNKSGKITVFHFDHKIRQNSSKEANWLESYISGLGINFHLLTWERDKKTVLNMKNASQLY